VLWRSHSPAKASGGMRREIREPQCPRQESNLEPSD